MDKTKTLPQYIERKAGASLPENYVLMINLWTGANTLEIQVFASFRKVVIADFMLVY